MHITKEGVQFSDEDAWSMPYALAPVILNALKKFRGQEFHSYPTDFDSVEDWQQALDKMIYAFDVNNEPDSANYDFEIKSTLKGEGYALEILNHWEFDRYSEDSLEYGRKREEGAELFGKYFWNLWD